MSRFGYREFLLTSAVLAGASACSSSVDPQPSQPHAARTELPRPLSAGEQTVIAASNAFSFALWKSINSAQKDSNVFVSPLSVSFALGMTMNGAAGTTFDEMRSALRFGNASLGSIDSGYKSLIGMLTSLDPSTTMKIANAIFYRSDYPFNQSFLNDASSYFDAQVAAKDFDDKPATVSAINSWASDKTNGRIPKVIDDYDPASVMFLMNAIYFKGSWRDRFDPARTRDGSFHPASGGDQSARLMSRQGPTMYAETDAYQAVDLAYGDSSFTMTVLLPKAGRDVESVAASLTPESWQSLASSFRSREVNLTFPKVTFSWKRSLVKDMTAQGMVTAFTDFADFSRMSSGGGLFINLLQQNTFVAIDEVGTEAAAVTTVGVGLVSLPAVTEMRVDRPYIIVIRERLSGTILFMGKIARMPS